MTGLSDRVEANVWADFFELVNSIDVPIEFLAERPMNIVPSESGVFDRRE
jgi:antitoxin VapB